MEILRRVFQILAKIPAFVTGFLIGAIVAAVVMTTMAWHGLHWSSDLLDDLLRRENQDRFETTAVRIAGKQSLNVARLEATEILERTEKTQAFWVSLPEVIVRARLPVQYNYFVQLSPAWKFERRGDTLVAHVPELGNSRPAVDLSGMRLDVVKGSVFRSDDAAKRDLQGELTDWLLERAATHREDVRDESRRSIEGFLRAWAKEATGHDLTSPIEVVFPTEPRSGAR